MSAKSYFPVWYGTPNLTCQESDFLYVAEETDSFQPTSQKGHQRVVAGGKTFEEWLKGKRDEKPKDPKLTDHKPAEEEIKKA